ncbi:MAG: Uncharacterized protein XD41_1738 [Desulfonauticus sp. 38_4375]|nr:MAG: Uncharacterized protein XD41_1738 [Desulfonauticus sp. 38_4375]
MKLKKNISYNIIVLRDDKSITTFRVKKWHINSVVTVLVIVFLYFFISPYFLLNISEKNKKNLKALEECTFSLSQSQFELKRLNNVKKILDKYDENYLQEIIAGISENKEKKSIDLKNVFEMIDLNIVKIDNVQCIKRKGNYVLIFELNNLEAEKESRGEVLIDAISRNGEVYSLSIRDEDLKFVIVRFKRVEVSFSLPAYLKEEDLFAFRLTVREENQKVVFRETYLLDSILI